MIRPFSKEFRDTYKKAYKHYEQGNWLEAKPLFEKTITLATYFSKDPEKPDPLSTNILKYMEEFNWKPPKDFQGWKEVDA